MGPMDTMFFIQQNIWSNIYQIEKEVLWQKSYLLPKFPKLELFFLKGVERLSPAVTMEQPWWQFTVWINFDMFIVNKLTFMNLVSGDQIT